jgi:ribokinase
LKQEQSGIFVVGSINVDTTFRVQHIPALGETVLAIGKTVAVGGKGANQAVAAARLGSVVRLVGSVGWDREGDSAIARLLESGVDVSSIGRSELGATGAATIIVDKDGENVIIVDQGANRHLEVSHVESIVRLGNPRVVMAQLEINLDAVLAAAKSTQGIFILNPAPIEIGPDSLAEILQYTNILVPNRTELGRLANRGTPMNMTEVDRCVAELDFAGSVIVTLGSDGVALYESGSSLGSVHIDPVRVVTVDTSGAGDAFCGALGHELASGKDLRSAATRANQVAAWCTTVYGAQIGDLPPV